MIPFSDFFGALRTMLGAADPKLVNRLAVVSNPRPTLGTPHEFRRRNTYAVFEATGFSGGAELCYNRIQLDEFLGAGGHTITTRMQPAMTHDALPLVNRKYRLFLKPEDVVNEPVEWDAQTGRGSFTLRAVISSLGISGTVGFTLIPGADPISELTLVGNLSMALYPSGQNTKGQAQFISYPCDTTDYNGVLSAWRTGEAITADKLEVVRQVTNLDWVMQAGDYSLAGAELTYAGEIRPGIDIPKPNHTRIATIMLGSGCTNFAGELTLYHNPN